MNTTVKNQVAELRTRRGIAASDLARRVNVSRQTIYAIEVGTYVPNTEVALHLAQELEVRWTNSSRSRRISRSRRNPLLPKS